VSGKAGMDHISRKAINVDYYEEGINWESFVYVDSIGH
jgi:hypothetical protein